MNLHIRPPQEHEWRICRMLLPETFADVASREYLLCLRNEAPRIVAAASFRRAGDAIGDLRIHVVPSFRRRRVGSQLVAYVARAGARSIAGTARILAEPGAEGFCLRNGFERIDGLTTVEAEIADMREYTRRLRDRLVLPAGASVIPLATAPVDEVVNLHARYVAQEGAMDPWRFLVAGTLGIGHSPVVTLDDRVVGMLLWELEKRERPDNPEGKESTAVVRSRVVTPGHQRGWVNTLLLSEGLDGAWASGARRVRFSYADRNPDTRKLAARFKAQTESVVALFRRRVAP